MSEAEHSEIDWAGSS
jgi:magnesium-transporting ATPase (P-type)